MQPDARSGRLPGMTNNSLRRGAAALAAVIVGLSGAIAAGSQTADATSARAVPKTTITFQVPDCEGCTINLIQGVWGKRQPKIWDTAQKTVEDGVVAFTVPTKHTRGMSASIGTPWEGQTGYVTTVAFRYGGEQIGDEIGFHEARGKTKGSACWAGTTDDAVTIPLTIRPVWVDGVHRHVRGTIAYANVTQDWMVPMRDVWDGVMGSQDVNICGEHRN